MDLKLLKQIKKETNKYSDLYSFQLMPYVDDIQSKINMLASEIFELKVEGLTDNITFTHQFNLIKSVKHLTHIVLMLINEQNKRALKTESVMKKKDNSFYVQSDNISFNKRILKENPVVNASINRIIEDRKKVYIKKFGYFKDIAEAYTIIKKEFNDVSNYLKILLDINDIKFNNYDNFDPLISGCQSLIYELIQLIISLMKADESRIINALKCKDIYRTEAYFIIMDFINSKKLYYENKCELLYENIMKINKIIENESDMGLLCKMNLLKQDEVQGLFLGNIEKLQDILKKEIISDIKVAYSNFYIHDKNNGIKNINDSVYNRTYDLYGPAAWNARNIIEEKPVLIRSCK